MGAAVARKLAPRLPAFSYVGQYRYLLTIRTNQSVPVFKDGERVAFALLQLLQCASRGAFAIHAYCFMPDHVHVVMEGLTEGSNFMETVRLWKQRTGFDAKLRFGRHLWQRGFHDRVMRVDDDITSVVAYVLENPVRAGLVANCEDYPFIGSQTDTLQGWLRRCRGGFSNPPVT